MSALLLTGSMPEYISGIEGAYAMRWFQKDRPPDVWEFAADQPLGDIGAAQKIREICASAASIAETMADLSGRKAEAQKAAEAERIRPPSSVRSNLRNRFPTMRCATFR